MPNSSDPRLAFAGPWARPNSNGDLEPPGTYTSILNRSGSRGGTTEVGVVHEHRFAFWFWNKWVREWRGAHKVVLVSIDWHQDLCAPAPEEEAGLAALDTRDDSEVALFAWSKLSPLNDVQILAAVQLDIIQEVHVLCKQDSFTDNDSEAERVFIYHDLPTFAAALEKVPAAILDIDLDYFTDSPDDCGGGEQVSLVSQSQIERILNPHNGIVASLLPNVVGLTIAVEPEFCGGLRNAHRLLGSVNDLLFDGTLLSENVRWNSRP